MIDNKKKDIREIIVSDLNERIIGSFHWNPETPVQGQNRIFFVMSRK